MYSLMMNFTDAQLQQCYERNFAEAAELSGEVRQVRALIGVHDLFQMLEGPHSSRVHETIEQLLVPGLRPGLRCWYQRSGADKDISARALRDHLSQLAGERLEEVVLPADKTPTTGSFPVPGEDVRQITRASHWGINE